MLGDGLHNAADALTAVPLLIAFALARRPATKRYTYGYGQAEDLGGLFVIAMIALSCRIGSAALVADGLHARTDGFTSLAVLVGAGGVALGWRDADPIVGLVITVAILGVLCSAVRQVGARLLDAVDPVLVERAAAAETSVPGVTGVRELRVRWVGHTLRAEVDATVDPELTVGEAHEVAHHVERHLLHDGARLAAATVHTSPAGAHR